MLDDAGRFDFTGEILDLAERLWCAYRETMADPEGQKERLLSLAYIVAVLRQDAEAIIAELAASPELQGIDLSRALAEALGALDAKALAALRADMQRRGWLAGQPLAD